MPREFFEFYCSGGCQGYLLVALDTEYNADVIVICPNCRHRHQRRVINGEISDQRHSSAIESATVHTIEPTMAAYSKEPRLRHLERRGPLGAAWARMRGQ